MFAQNTEGSEPRRWPSGREVQLAWKPGAHVRGGAWLSTRAAASSAAPARSRWPTRSPAAASRARSSGPQQARDADPARSRHPKVADRQLDVLQLAAVHRQEGPQGRSTSKYGGHVKYVEDINDNDEFYGKVRQQLQADQPIGRDIVTLTDFMAVKWVRNRYVEPLDKKNMPERRRRTSSTTSSRSRTTRSATSRCRGSRAPSASATTRRRPGAS